jgi:hypothetical protein
LSVISLSKWRCPIEPERKAGWLNFVLPGLCAVNDAWIDKAKSVLIPHGLSCTDWSVWRSLKPYLQIP